MLEADVEGPRFNIDWCEQQLNMLSADRYASFCEAVEEFVRLETAPGRQREAYNFSRKLVRDFPEICEDAQAEFVSRKYYPSCHS